MPDLRALSDEDFADEIVGHLAGLPWNVREPLKAELACRLGERDRLLAAAEKVQQTHDAAREAAVSGQPTGVVYDLWRLADEALADQYGIVAEIKEGK